MTNPQTGPYPVLFAKNISTSYIRAQVELGNSRFNFDIGPGGVGSVPWVIAKSAGFQQLWLDGKLEVSDRFDFSTTLDELPAIGASDDLVEWEEIEGKPEEFPPAEHDRAWADITGKPEEFPPATHTHAWGQVTGKPTTFAPADHSHAITDVTGLQGALDAKVATTDSRLSDARTPKTHTHAIADVTDLQTTLNGKAASSHEHAWGDITGKPATFAPTIGTTATTAAAGNDSRLSDSRTPKTHTHAWADITDPPTIPPAAPVAAAQADSTAEDIAGLVADFNSLLGKLRAAGIVAS